MAENKNFIFAVGKRKESVARLRLYTSMPSGLSVENPKKGEIYVNGKTASEYFGGIIALPLITSPLVSTNSQDKYFISVKVVGGGQRGQLQALVHALSRALSLADNKNRGILKKMGLLERDARVRERRKVGMGGKARRKRQSPKR